MTDRDALLCAIIANPDEDLPRLMYADEIEGDEPERAEFIRVQCELEPMRFVAIGDQIFRQHELKARELALWEDRRYSWIDGLIGPEWKTSGLNREPNLGWTAVAFSRGQNRTELISAAFYRGFIGRLVLTAADWLAHADAILAAHPVVEVTLTTLPLFFYETTDGEWVDTSDLDWGDSDHGLVCRMIETKCRYRWSSVKTWNLPPERWAGNIDGRQISGVMALVSAETIRQREGLPTVIEELP